MIIIIIRDSLRLDIQVSNKNCSIHVMCNCNVNKSSVCVCARTQCMNVSGECLCSAVSSIIVFITGP
jgi:peptidyl-tRNA hydrolase